MEFDPFANLPRATWTEEAEEDVVDHDTLMDLLRDAAGALTARIHQERSSPGPRPEVVDRLTAQRSRFLGCLRDLRIADARSADELRNECLEVIRGDDE